VSYKTAWFMMHRLREAMADLKPAPMGGEGGQVQADETYCGNTSKRAKHYKKGHSQKTNVVALVEPKTGRVRARAMVKANAETVREFLVTNVDRKSELHTDESALYTKTGKEFAAHKTVNHGWNQRGYSVGKDGQTTNNVETFSCNSSGGCAGLTFTVAPSMCSGISMSLRSSTTIVLASVLPMENGRR
jgi:hypothetical protein